MKMGKPYILIAFDPMGPRQRKNYKRRVFGLLLCCLPILLAFSSLIVGLFERKKPFFSGIVLVLVGGFFALLNFYLSLIRPLIYRLIHGLLKKYQFVSGIPVIGNLFIVVGVLYGFGSIRTAGLALLFILLDTGGLAWFAIATWKDAGLWDKQSAKTDLPSP